MSGSAGYGTKSRRRCGNSCASRTTTTSRLPWIAAHAEAIVALRTVVEEVRVLIAFVRHQQPELVDQLTELRTEEDDHWNRWLGALERLVDAGAT